MIERGDSQRLNRIPCPQCGRETAVKSWGEAGFRLVRHGNCPDPTRFYAGIRIVVYDGWIELRRKGHAATIRPGPADGYQMLWGAGWFPSFESAFQTAIDNLEEIE